MWEVRAADGRLDELVAWVSGRIAPSASLFASADGEPRVVVIDPTAEVVQALAQVPRDLVARPAHSWNFRPVPR
jgi:hypothetical protein